MGAIIDGNDILVLGAADAIGILVRGTSRAFKIVNNTLTNVGTGCAAADAIAIITFSGSAALENEVQSEFVVSGNTAIDFRGTGVKIHQNCRRGLVTHNVIRGLNYRIDAAFVAASSAGVMISSNEVRSANNLCILSGGKNGINQIIIEHNYLEDVGSAGGWAIDSTAVSQNVLGVCVRHNIWGSAPAGTRGLWNTPYVAATNNRAWDNDIPAGLAHVNPSFARYVDTVTTLSRASGERLVGAKYSFVQGSIDMAVAPGAGWPWAYSIGANLDGSSPNCTFGDAVLVGCSTNLDGAQVSGFVAASHQLRIRVVNTTQDNLSIPAATWYVIVVKYQ